jgi:hypothetical protein
MQSDAVAIVTVDMGTDRGVLRRLGGRGGPYAEAQGHRECCTRGSVPGYEREVPPSLYLSLGGTDLCPLKVPDDASHV